MSNPPYRLCDIKECFAEAKYVTVMTVRNASINVALETKIHVCEYHTEKVKKLGRKFEEIH